MSRGCERMCDKTCKVCEKKLCNVRQKCFKCSILPSLGSRDSFGWHDACQRKSIPIGNVTENMDFNERAQAIFQELELNSSTLRGGSFLQSWSGSWSSDADFCGCGSNFDLPGRDWNGTAIQKIYMSQVGQMILIVIVRLRWDFWRAPIAFSFVKNSMHDFFCDVGSLTTLWKG